MKIQIQHRCGSGRISHLSHQSLNKPEKQISWCEAMLLSATTTKAWCPSSHLRAAATPPLRIVFVSFSSSYVSRFCAAGGPCPFSCTSRVVWKRQGPWQRYGDHWPVQHGLTQGAGSVMLAFSDLNFRGDMHFWNSREANVWFWMD
jgi:hypothetical protein